MFSQSQRDSLLDCLTEISKSTPGIQGLIQVGSGAYGYRDEYSDLDIVIVVEDGEWVPEVHHELIDMIERSQSVLRHKLYQHESDIYVSCFLLANYLELDLGVWSFPKLRATKPQWKVLFDRSAPSIEQRLESTLSSNHSHLDKTARDSMSLIWQFARGATIAFLRGNLIKACKEIDVIRDKTAELIALREGIFYDVAKEMGKVESSRVHALIETYEGAMNRKGLHANLVAAINLYFEVVSDILGSDNTEKDYRIVMDMVNDLVAYSGRV